MLVAGSSAVPDHTADAVIYSAAPSQVWPNWRLDDPDSGCRAQYRQARDQGNFPLLMWWETPPQVSVHAVCHLHNPAYWLSQHVVFHIWHLFIMSLQD